MSDNSGGNLYNNNDDQPGDYSSLSNSLITPPAVFVPPFWDPTNLSWIPPGQNLANPYGSTMLTPGQNSYFSSSNRFQPFEQTLLQNPNTEPTDTVESPSVNAIADPEPNARAAQLRAQLLKKLQGNKEATPKPKEEDQNNRREVDGTSAHPSSEDMFVVDSHIGPKGHSMHDSSKAVSTPRKLRIIPQDPPKSATKPISDTAKVVSTTQAGPARNNSPIASKKMSSPVTSRKDSGTDVEEMIAQERAVADNQNRKNIKQAAQRDSITEKAHPNTSPRLLKKDSSSLPKETTHNLVPTKKIQNLKTDSNGSPKKISQYPNEYLDLTKIEKDGPHKTLSNKSKEIFNELGQTDLDDVREWLEITGFHNCAYRKRTIERQRKLADLQRQKEELEREEQEEEELFRRGRARSVFHPDTMASPALLRSVEGSGKPIGYQTITKVSPDSGDATLMQGQKRRHDGTEDPMQIGKVARTSASDNHGPAATTDADAENNISSALVRTKPKAPLANVDLQPRNMRGMPPPPFRQRSRSSSPPHHTYGSQPPNSINRVPRHYQGQRESFTHKRGGSRDSSPNSNGRDRYSYSKFRYGDRDSSHYRPDHDPSRNISIRGRGKNDRNYDEPRDYPVGADSKLESESLNLRAGDSRYFMVKSFNFENVEISQRENTWCTQEHNLKTFLEAFEKSRNVILVFSVNQSRAFQGYARMETQPGAPGVAEPTWQKKLKWTSTPPFKIRWIAKTQVAFRHVGHLINAYNENHAVLIGRDGQEIEGECGRSLCEILDKAQLGPPEKTY
ncbi:MAG: hypothetical protein M1834_003052 [Cirrosporium novae-zelandiae]|nr:MAG: hypothetical protein M1834_003052 [Cirrosporium novae-zelandiae]